MKVIVTGATGRIGRATCPLLAADGHEVIGVDKSRDREFAFPIRVTDLTHRESCYAALDGGDVLVHLANIAHQKYADAQTVFAHNVSTNMNVFQAAYELGMKQIVFASSLQAISGDIHNMFGKPTLSPPYFPVDDQVPLKPENPYALSKATGEMQLEYFSRMADICATAIRFPWIFGNHVPEYVLHYPPYAYASLHQLDAGSLIAAILRASLTGYRIYTPTALDLVNVFGGPAQVAAERFPDVPRKQDPLTSLIDIAPITRDVGWTPTHPINVPKLRDEPA